MLKSTHNNVGRCVFINIPTLYHVPPCLNKQRKTSKTNLSQMHQCTKTTPFAKSNYPLEPIHKITRTQQKKLMAVLINKKQETTQRRIKAPN